MVVGVFRLLLGTIPAVTTDSQEVSKISLLLSPFVVPRTESNSRTSQDTKTLKISCPFGEGVIKYYFSPCPSHFWWMGGAVSRGGRHLVSVAPWSLSSPIASDVPGLQRLGSWCLPSSALQTWQEGELRASSQEIPSGVPVEIAIRLECLSLETMLGHHQGDILSSWPNQASCQDPVLWDIWGFGNYRKAQRLLYCYERLSSLNYRPSFKSFFPSYKNIIYALEIMSIYKNKENWNQPKYQYLEVNAAPQHFWKQGLTM